MTEPTEASKIAGNLKAHVRDMASITRRVSPAEEQSEIYRDMSDWMHEAAVLMNAASAALTAAAQVREKVTLVEIDSRQNAMYRLNNPPTEPDSGPSVLGIPKDRTAMMTKPTDAAEILALPPRSEERVERFSVRGAHLTSEHEAAGYSLDDGFLAARDPDGQWWRAVQISGGEWRRIPFEKPTR